ncbi:IclR family transcriptional regulator [Salinirubrum litoreum]|uniref:IclR family transcriptional regulator n=1 Tax=Salinirubrum litoreum TaxID=1126234 RepID=A0ABD5RGV4_9EURY|nr:IclR family transcriptional regulator [Salinirubrum litoreum]
MAQSKNTVRSSAKTLRILEAIHELGGVGVTELARYLDMSKATVHHHLSTLEQNEYVVNDGSTYRTGLKLLEMGERARQQSGLFEIAKHDVDELAAQTGELANLMMEEHGKGVYVHIASGEQAIRLDTRVGTRQYLHTSALGKAILAHMPEQRFEEVIDRHGLPAQTPNTVTEKAMLEKELDEIRKRGVAFDGEERAEGIRCVAAPITDNENQLVGAVSVSAPSARMKHDRFRNTIPEMVRDTATVIGINVSYS